MDKPYDELRRGFTCSLNKNQENSYFKENCNRHISESLNNFIIKSSRNSETPQFSNTKLKKSIKHKIMRNSSNLVDNNSNFHIIIKHKKAETHREKSIINNKSGEDMQFRMIHNRSLNSYSSSSLFKKPLLGQKLTKMSRDLSEKNFSS